MKSTKILIAAAVAVTAVLSGCTKEVVTGIDTSKVCAKDFNYDAKNSSEKTAAFYWDAEEAIKAGATSFSVQLYQYEDARDIDMYNSSIGQTVQATAETHDAVIFSGLTKGKKYFARVRANYPRSIYSEWTDLLLNGEKAQIKVGSDQVIKYGDFESPAPVVLSGTALPKSLKISWMAVEGATAYNVEYKESSASSWTKAGSFTTTETKLESLKPSTSYDIRVQAEGVLPTGGKTTSEYATLTVSTAAEGSFPKEMGTAEEFIAWINDGAAIADPADTYKLTKDIDLKGATLTQVTNFVSTLDGQNHSLKNFKFGSALFAKNEGTLKNIVFDSSCEFTAADDEFAALVVENKGTVSGCVNKANVTRNGGTSSATILAGLVAANYGTVDNCTNEGTVFFNAAGATVAGSGTAGIVGFSSGAVKNCTNKGAVKLVAGCCAAKATVREVASSHPAIVGGVCGLGATGFSMDNCINNGAVTYECTSIETIAASTNINRNQVGGVVGAPAGLINNCKNYGEINVTATTSDATAPKKEYIVGVAGISGGDYHSKNTLETTITNCANEGSITVNFSASASNSTVGGIVAWPGTEGAENDKWVENCTNKGNITISGAGKGRFGGVTGGAGNVKKCINYGHLVNHTKISGSCIGGVCGYSNYDIQIVECENYGTVESDGAADMVYVGGLLGAQGGQNTIKLQGSKVKCTVIDTNGSGMYAGIVLGRYNSSAKTIQLGTSEKPIQVLKGCKITTSAVSADIDAGNYLTYFTGTQYAKDPSLRPIYASFVE